MSSPRATSGRTSLNTRSEAQCSVRSSASSIRSAAVQARARAEAAKARLLYFEEEAKLKLEHSLELLRHKREAAAAIAEAEALKAAAYVLMCTPSKTTPGHNISPPQLKLEDMPRQSVSGWPQRKSSETVCAPERAGQHVTGSLTVLRCVQHPKSKRSIQTENMCWSGAISRQKSQWL